jgi:NTE family protein
MISDLNAATAERIALLQSVQSLGALDEDLLRQIAEVAEYKTVPRGEILIHEGEQASTLYIVLKGRFVVLVGDAPIAEIAMGEPIGELAFFAGGARTATVVAARNSMVMCLTREVYDTLAVRTPALSNGILKALSERLARTISDSPELRPKAGKVCSVFPGGTAVMDGRFLAGLKQAFADAPRWTVLDEGDCGSVSEDAGALAGWLEQMEAIHGNLLLMCKDPEAHPVWSQVAADNSDTVVIALDASRHGRAGAQPAQFERRVFETTLRNNIQIALYRPQSSDSTRNASVWLDARDTSLHHHVALDSTADFQRLGRFIRGEATGLVMCGGGSLGTAHLGAIAALQGLGYSFDFVGGTSVGSAMGAALAIGLDPHDVMDLCEDIFIKSRAMSRLTVPRHSLLDHHRLDTALAHHYRDFTVEDAPLNFFAVATSLTHNDVHVIRRGPIWEAVRASASLPGIFPPFVREDGGVLIDGGLLDNVPVSVMRDLKAGPNIVLNFLAPKPWRVKASYDELPTRGQALASLLRNTSGRKKGRHPSVMSTLSRAMVVNARKLMQDIDMGDDVLLNLSTLRGMSYMDWKRGRELFDFAHRQMSEALDACAEDANEVDALGRLRLAAQIINAEE